VVGVQTGLPGGINLGGGVILDATRGDGVVAQGVLRVSGNVSSGETVTIGTTVFRVAVVATDSGKDAANGELVGTDPLVPLLTFPAHGLKGGDVFRVDNEIFRVTNVLNANQLQAKRGMSGTTIATHADGASIFVEAVTGAGNVAVGLNATFTPTAFIAALVPTINDQDVCGENVFAVAMAAAGPVLLQSASRDKNHGTITLVADASALATTETLANGAFDAATLGGGTVAGANLVVSRVVIAAEVTAGAAYFSFPFVPTVVDCRVFTSVFALKAHDGAKTVSGNTVIVDNTGATDFAAGDTILLTVRS
jgi:hypothetical protein